MGRMERRKGDKEIFSSGMFPDGDGDGDGGDEGLACSAAGGERKHG